jgi:hypothetical protein
MDRSPLRQKLRAALINLAISLAVLCGILAVVYLAWYPDPYFLVKDINRVTWMLVAVQLALGPLLTLVLYRKGKKGLVLDLSVITALQVFALAYGTWALYQERPWFMVYAVDRFTILASREVDFAAVSRDEFLRKPLAGPVMVMARVPSDPAAHERLLRETLFQGRPDLSQRPEYWSDYQNGLPEIVARARTVAELRAARPQDRQLIDRAISASGHAAESLVFVPAIGKSRDFAIILHPESGEVLDAVPSDPWLTLSASPGLPRDGQAQGAATSTFE